MPSLANCTNRILPVASYLLAAAVLSAAAAPGDNYDVVVVGGSSGAFGAALAAGRMGAKVALIEDTPVLGGMLSNGISNIDTFSYESLSGIFEEFRHQVIEYYRPVMNADPIFAQPDSPSNHVDGRSRQSNGARNGGRWEPHVADRIFKQMMAAAPSVHVFYKQYATGVLRQGNRVTGVIAEDDQGVRREFHAAVVIDATHEGDIAAWAGVPYRVGREARTPLEPHAGDITFFDETAEILGGSGRQDAAVVSYGLRLTIKNYPPGDAERHLLSSPPPGYNPAEFKLSSYSAHPTMPNGKSEMNVNPVGNEMQEVNWSWPDASPKDRKALAKEYRDHALAFLYYLQHEKGMKNAGLPDDEFMDNGHVPYRVFVREARRIEGVETMTEADINPFILGRGLIPALRSNSVAIGHYPMDSKPVRRKTDPSAPDKGEGDFFLTDASSPFQVPFGAIVPKNVDGLLVPVAMSATHVAFSAIRMDPTWMAMGQAAGVAAVLSIRANVEVRNLPVQSLQRELLRQKCRLAFYWDVPLEHPSFAAIQWLTLRQAAMGYPDRLFRPDTPTNRAETAALVTRALGLWPSVSGAHFTDVPYSHWAFRDVETLFDNRLLEPFGISQRWQQVGGYDAQKHSGFARTAPSREFLPGQSVTWKELIQMLRAADHGADDSAAWLHGVLAASEFGRGLSESSLDLNAFVKRGEACSLLAALIDPLRNPASSRATPSR